MKMKLNFPEVDGLEQVQKYLKSLLTQKKVSCYLCEEKIEMVEVLSPYIGLPKIIQHALLTDYLSGTDYVWDSGIYLEKHDKAFSGYLVRTREPKVGAGKTPVLVLILDCVNTGVLKKDNINQLHLDNLPALAMANASGKPELLPVDWADDMEDFFQEKEEVYNAMSLAGSASIDIEGVEYAVPR